MTDSDSPLARSYRYRFSRPSGEEIETCELANDEAADSHARTLSRSASVPVVIHRLLGHVDWEYVTEADDRP
jgi:hypothetical protein